MCTAVHLPKLKTQLTFDEVITGWGRLGPPFAAQYFNVTPDLLTMAKGTNNAAAPMGAVAASARIHHAIVNGAPAGIELFHGYTIEPDFSLISGRTAFRSMPYRRCGRRTASRS
ncbi:hypothetical protein BN2476_1330007 [Paraburkholderia piptadeniae]|uniref:Uncharacterized protein n=1 Tax=Paraburkholderia piptadeniae TaxID=1701573 RepID=A0A1N7SW59_9BURK|nr:hypothetical protein BN2476_1330007 [Paraburkholderia piptadeniae]